MTPLLRLGVYVYRETTRTVRVLFDAATVGRYYAGYEDGHRAGVAFTQRDMERSK